MKHNYSRFYALIKQINANGVAVTKEDIVLEFTSGKTTSLTSLKHWEFQELERRLQQSVNSPNKAAASNYKNDPLDSTRKAIISQFLSIGRSVQDAKDWAEKYGVNGTKKLFNQYTGQELFVLLQNAKKVKADYIKSANKKLTNGKGIQPKE